MGTENEKSLIISTESRALSLVEGLRDLDARAEARAEHARAKSTRHAYEGDFGRFTAWREENAIPEPAVTPRVLRAYLEFLATERLSASSIARAYAGIVFHLRRNGHEAWAPRRRPPEIDEYLSGLRRESAARGELPRRKAALDGADLPALLAAVSTRCPLTTARDRALLLVGFLGGCRRSEVVGMQRECLSASPEGLVWRLTKSKTNQQGREELKALPRDDEAPELCPVRAVATWLKAAREAGTPIETGPVFRPIEAGRVVLVAEDGRPAQLNDRYVARLVKRVVRTIGLDADDFSGHSLRAGFITTAAELGVGYGEIMDQTGHKRVEQVRDYVRRANVLKDTAARGLISRARARRAGT